MSYDDIEIEDMEWSEGLQAFTYPCPCGDLFQITRVGRGTYEFLSERAGSKKASSSPTQPEVCRRSYLMERKSQDVPAVPCISQ